MSDQRAYRGALATAVTITLLLASAAPVLGQAAQDAVESDQATLDAALADLEDTRLRAARNDARAREASEELDRVLAELQQARGRLGTRAPVMYRNGQRSLLWVLLGAETFSDFLTRWDLLIFVSQRDAADLELLRTAADDVRRAAEDLMTVQAEQARALDEAEREVATAREALADSEAALKEYESRLAEGPQAPASPAPTPSDSTPQAGGTGEWSTGVASHYSWTFTGRGASGEPIGPYSMMVAHLTLPFGTLVEFEYGGRRAVASVQDRGPHVSGRVWDLGPGVARALDFTGVHEVRYRVISQ